MLSWNRRAAVREIEQFFIAATVLDGITGE